MRALDSVPAVRVWLGLDSQDSLAACIANEFIEAPACLSIDTVPVMAGPGNQPSCLVVVGAGRVGTTTSRRARRWARGTVGHRVGEGSADVPATLR